MRTRLKSWNENLNQPLISIIIVVFNAEKTLEQAILSIINQTYPKIEFIIIDGASTDRTCDILTKYQNEISYWISEPDKGIYDAMNKGLKIANGNWAFFLGSDDVLINSNVIENMVINFTSENVIYYGNAQFKSTNKIYDVSVSKWFLCFKNISHQTLFYPKFIYKNYFYDLKYALFSDHIYNIQLFHEDKFKFVHLPVITVIYNDVGSSAEGIDPNYFRALPQVLWITFGKRYAIYVYLRFAVFKFKKYLINKFYFHFINKGQS